MLNRGGRLKSLQHLNRASQGNYRSCDRMCRCLCTIQFWADHRSGSVCHNVEADDRNSWSGSSSKAPGKLANYTESQVCVQMDRETVSVSL